MTKGAAAGGSVVVLAGEIIKAMTWSKIKWATVISVGAMMVTAVVGFAVVSGNKPRPVRGARVKTIQATVNASSPPIAAVTNSYQAFVIETVPGFELHVVALNNRGQVVGSVDSTNHETHSFLWDHSTIKDLGTFGGSKSLATGINDDGDIVGLILTNGARHVFLRHNGEMADLGTIDHFAKLGDEGDKYNGGPGIIYYAPRVAINGFSQVTGRLMDERDNQRSFLLNQGRTSYFGLIGDGNVFEAEAINNRGQILGRATQGRGPMRSMLWQDGELIDLGSLEGTRSIAAAINDRGTVVGSLVFTNSGSQAFAWEAGQVRRLATGKSTITGASAINNSGLVVGSARTADNRSCACLWSGEEILDLNDLVKIESGWRLTSASAINDRGQILARAVNGKRRRDYLLSPENLAPLPQQPGTTAAAAPNSLPPIEPFNLSSFEQLPDGAFRLAFAGSPNAKYVIEASTNLVNWTLLGPATNNGGKVEFTDEEAKRFTLRFYRSAMVK
jgi:probable HAF family extracellular repeat protein